MHSERRRRGFLDDEGNDFRNAPRVAYRRPPTYKAADEAEALFATKKVTENSVTSKPAAESAPPITARVKFFNGAKRFGILRTVDGGIEYFLPAKILPPGVGEEQLRPASEMLVRVAPDAKGQLPVVVEIVQIKEAALRTEIGTVVRWDNRSGFVELDCGGQWVYLAARCVAEAGLDPTGLMGARLEVDATVHHKPAAVAIRKI